MFADSNRRDFLRSAGLSALGMQLALGLPSFALGAETRRKQRLIFVFSPNGVIPKHFWPETLGTDFELKRILEPLADFRDQTMTLHGLNNQIKGDGDGHMRGIGCLLTGIELFPGDIQGGSDTPAGWSMGISVDQYLRNKMQADEATRTRFGSLEFGLMVPERADTWTRLSYAGANQPVAPIDDPYQMFDKLYGQAHNNKMLASVLDGLADDYRRLQPMISSEDRRMLDQHLDVVRKLEKNLQNEIASQENREEGIGHLVPELPANVEDKNDNMPQVSKMQVDLLVSAMQADFTRIATFQITNSVGGARMKWLGIEEGHHSLSHKPDSDEESYEKLIKINTWYCEQVAYMAKRLAETPEPGGEGSMLDNTTIVWTNELGKGNSHTRNNIPFVCVGGGLGWKTGQAIDFKGTPHNRLLMSFCESMGHPVEKFGNPDFCGDGVLTGLV
ncbi:DUF1552 domain-containing protein [Calycomorphotria hydatis]|uniref:Secreted protein containing DUF1552 n=1 Tax=Calycomorphotria hydatis TaxID=2528027 RepID=A0A517T4E5_9PLAN|nr:DUF1552 domain-containing protein [Calycomorphotria hydatis]QDT63231.1 hypothetical protein V22_04500 [Calycomorphotria hydatis]